MISKYLQRVYSNPPCWELVSDVYENELNLKVKDYKPESASPRVVASAFRLALHNAEHGFVLTNLPEDFCIVLMGRTSKLGLHHCGIYYKGKVLHALPAGNLYQDISSLKDTYKLVQYWVKQIKEDYEN